MLNSKQLIRFGLFCCCVIYACECSAQRGIEGCEWTQWGGRNRNFRLPASPLSRQWSDNGPTVKWRKEIGGGYAGISIAGDQMFTTIRKDGKEIDLALDLKSGNEVWTKSLAVPEIDLDYEMGPFATPLISIEQVVFLGVTGILRSRDVETGKLNWKLELDREFASLEKSNGYASSPLRIGNRVIVIAGAEDASIVAVDLRSGRPVWSEHDYKMDYASPLAVIVDGTTQLICHMEEEVVSMRPEDGKLLWRLPSTSDRTQHVISPIIIGENKILTSITSGVDAIRLSRDAPEPLWKSNLIRSQVGNLIYLPAQNLIIGAAGASTGSPVVALNAESGELAWKSRQMQCGFLWSIGDRLFNLSRSGELVQGIATPAGLEILAAHRIFDETKVWSAPAVSGSTLIVKSQSQIIAFDLSR